MCRISVIADDWVVKGFHIHVDDVELALRPGNERGVVVIRAVFASTRDDEFREASRAVRGYLGNPDVRDHCCGEIDRAIGYLKGYDGELTDLAIGRQAELKFLKCALRRYREAR
jgi:hypothetical protein